MKKSIEKVISIILLITITISSMPIGAIMAAVRPSVGVSAPSRTSVNKGGSVSYTIIYTEATSINLSSSYVTLNGFSANVSVSGSGSTRTVTLSNIQGTAGNKSIAIKANSARNSVGGALSTPNSVSFYLNGNSSNNTVQDSIRPSIAVSSPSKSTVNVGGSVSYTLTFTDNVGVSRVNTSASYITLNGFTANVSVSNSGNRSVVTLSNIQGTAGRKSISIRAGAANDKAGNGTAAINSTTSFNLVQNSNTNNNSGNSQNNSNADKVRPSISISAPNNKEVYKGGTVVYTVTFADNRGVQRINLSSAYVVLNGFTANVSVAGKGLSRMIALSNIQGAVGKKTISVKAGAASDAAGNTTLATPSSVSFTLLEKQTTPSNTKPSNDNSRKNNTNKSIKKNNMNLVIGSGTVSVRASEVTKSEPKIISTCSDDLSILGDINKEVKTFSTWFTSSKTVTTYAVENNYVAKDEEMTYYVDYYNGKDTAANNVKIKLNIPYNVQVLEINSDGVLKTQTSAETEIEWNKASIQSGAKCRLYVKVKYLQNVALENSDKISEEFYVGVKTSYDDKNDTSYLRQLFIDKNNSKRATVEKYLSAIDSSNSIRPDDKITRAEFAKLLVDSGVVKVESGNDNYKKYKDADEIPAYAKEAVSAIYETGIIETFADSEFKPNNPISRDEFFKIVAKASEYISKNKIKVKDSPFIYTEDIDDKDKTISDNKKYIMELIRQNIIKREDTKPDEYIVRKDAVEVINALTFRGPYVEEVAANSVKFTDIKEENKYFYNIVGAANTYTYTYSDTLLQKIVEVK